MHKTVTIHPILGLISISKTLPSLFYSVFFAAASTVPIQIHFLSHSNGILHSFSPLSLGCLLSLSICFSSFVIFSVSPTNAIVMLLRSLTYSLSFSLSTVVYSFALTLFSCVCVRLRADTALAQEY